MPSLSVTRVVEDRCARCTCRDERQELLRDAAIEAARRVMARFLVWERLHLSYRLSDSIDAHHALEEAMQDARDALAAERRSR